ncbi:hypothetical protein L484_023441 [Morus notabilis]|uniref:Uncharacterized protein n=1 Tax=Morus notabilis TaxID=981085 RepID=W9RDK6_9ROSA|nr:hypothetical protein L484_023441 [Morus notabilis]
MADEDEKQRERKRTCDVEIGAKRKRRYSKWFFKETGVMILDVDEPNGTCFRYDSKFTKCHQYFAADSCSGPCHHFEGGVVLS